MYKISICIPTYNRKYYLYNLLNSIYKNKEDLDKVEICISDNNSDDETYEVVKKFQNTLKINYSKNLENIGLAKNIIAAASMSKGEFIWLLGDDDMIMPGSIKKLKKILQNNNDIDFVYVNAYNLSKNFLSNFSYPFDTKYLPKEMDKFSKWNKDGKIKFFELINPRVSFDYLGGIFLSVFRRELWMQNIDCINLKLLNKKNTFSNIENTFPHIKIFAASFNKSLAYFNSEPLAICLNDVREWLPIYPYIRNFQLVEGLKEYRKNGLSYYKYFLCKNKILKNFIPDMIYILLNKDNSGYKYINFRKILREYLFYPNIFLSVFWFMIRKIKNIFNINKKRGVLDES